MADGQLKIGANFLKIGANYLRIGPVPVSWPQAFGFQSDGGSPTMVFTNPDAGVDILILLQIVADVISVTVPTIDTPGGDLTWTLVATNSLFEPITGASRRLSMYSATLPAATPSGNVTTTIVTTGTGTFIEAVSPGPGLLSVVQEADGNNGNDGPDLVLTFGLGGTGSIFSTFLTANDVTIPALTALGSLWLYSAAFVASITYESGFPTSPQSLVDIMVEVGP